MTNLEDLDLLSDISESQSRYTVDSDTDNETRASETDEFSHTSLGQKLSIDRVVLRK
jgi:hypothetical protein